MNSPATRTAFIVGATGLVGGCLLTRLIDDPRYSAVTTLGRRARAVEHEHVTHLVHDFSASATLAPIDADVLFCCLGTTIKQAGSQAAFAPFRLWCAAQRHCEMPVRAAAEVS